VSTRLARNAEAVYAALKAAGPGWHPRSTLARALNKARLSNGEVAALELLVMTGRVEMRRAEIDSPIPVRSEYRICE
jgi:hypothetical protein